MYHYNRSFVSFVLAFLLALLMGVLLFALLPGIAGATQDDPEFPVHHPTCPDSDGKPCQGYWVCIIRVVHADDKDDPSSHLQLRWHYYKDTPAGNKALLDILADYPMSWIQTYPATMPNLDNSCANRVFFGASKNVIGLPAAPVQ